MYMSKPCFTFIFLTLLSLQLHAQKFVQWWDPRDENIDSLQRVLLTAKDTARIDCLNELGFAYYGLQKDSTLYYVTQAFQQAQEINYPRGMAISYFYKAQSVKDSNEKKKNISEAITYAKKANDKRTEGFAYALAGWFYSNNGQLGKALYFASILDSVAAISNDEMLLANAYYLRSNIYISQGKLYEGLQLQVKLNQLQFLGEGDEAHANNLHGIA